MRKRSILFQTVENFTRTGEKFSFEAPILGGSRRPERFTPSDVAAFVRGIDPSFDNLASRFLQEVGIDRSSLRNQGNELLSLA